MMDFEQLKELIKIVNDSELKSFSLNADGVSVSMSKNEGMAVEHTVSAEPVKEQALKTESINEEPAVKTAEPKKGNIIKAPIVGTFYAASKPSAPAMKSVGDSVKKGESVCIIEAMKIMNEITSEFDGTVDEVFVENGEIVEFGQPLFRIV